MSLPEKWHENKLTIKDIINHRAKLVYSRFKSKIKSARTSNKFLQIMQEVSIADKSVSRHHARVLEKNSKIFIQDLGSSRGVIIDGEKIET